MLKVIRYYKTKKGVSSKIYNQQKQSSKERGHILPTYTKEEFSNWLFSQTKFEELYNNRVKSGYETNLKPSVDRKDDNKGYSFNNIQLMTWKENKDKSYKDRKMGIIGKQIKGVIGTHKTTGEILEFHSLREAERQIGIHNWSIGEVCRGKRKSAGGYIWRYKKD